MEKYDIFYFLNYEGNGNYRYEEVLEYFDKALEIDTKYVNAWINKGHVLRKLGKYKKLLKCYDKVLEMYSENPEAWYNKELSLEEAIESEYRKEDTLSDLEHIDMEKI